jgi:hypothetical protein
MCLQRAAGLAFLLVVGLIACSARPERRIDDRFAVLDSAELPQFENFLNQIERESGIDIRFVFVDTVPGGDLERFAVHEARSLGIGQGQDRRGLLFAYEMRGQRLRIEVGPTLQSIFTDRFVGYLMRNHVRTFFAAGNPTLSMRVTLLMLLGRVRRAALGLEYDPRAAEFIEDRRRLSTGGGATAQGLANPSRNSGFLNRLATAETRALYQPQPSVERAYERYLEWLGDGQLESDVPLFTRATQGYLSRIPISPAYAEYILLEEYGRAYQVLEHDSLALLYFTDDPLNTPYFFRRDPGGWRMDIFAAVRNSHSTVGGAWTWTMVPRNDDFTQTFVHRYRYIGSDFIRLVGGDNRPIPVAATAQPLPPREWLIDSMGTERLTVAEASDRISSLRGKPVVVLLYENWDKATYDLFPKIVEFLRGCQASGATVLGFAIDDEWEGIIQLRRHLREQGAPFPPVALYQWPSGTLTRAMSAHGIQIRAYWKDPLIAVLDRDGRAIAQAEGIADGGQRLSLGAVAEACSSK